MPDTVVVFDLDGTLIDSAPSVLDSLRMAFADVGVQPTAALTEALIGPPLGATVAALLAPADQDKKDRVVAAFKTAYDSQGYRSTRVYAGAEALLEQLSRQQVAMYIATNKRILPTRQIVQHLGWHAWFRTVWALDVPTPAWPDKGAMLQHIAAELGGPGGQAIVYVGDRREDMVAARLAGMAFFWASWGYGQAADFDPALHLTTPQELVNRLTHATGLS